MKLRAVLTCEPVGYHATWPPARGCPSREGEAPPDKEADDLRSKSYRLSLDCGHFAMCVAAVAPEHFDCMVCGQAAVQLLLPMTMPVFHKS